MRGAYPLSIYRYIQSVSSHVSAFAYLKLDENHYVTDFRGDLAQYGLGELKYGMPIEEQFPPMVGLLPVRYQPFVLLYVNVLKNRFVDIHIIRDLSNQWLVLIDRTIEGRELQAAQAQRLNEDLTAELTDKRRNGCQK